MKNTLYIIIISIQLFSCGSYYKTRKLSKQDAITLYNLSNVNKNDSLIINPPYIAEPTSSSSTPNHVSIQTLYATDRNILSKGARPYYGTDRSNLQYGVCNVSIPITHSMGAMESKSLFKFQLTEDPQKHIILVNVKSLSKENFINTINEEAVTEDKKSALIFIHGYNSSFGEAASKTAQLAYDLNFKGIPVFYSWPSQESPIKYPVDEENSNWSVSNFKSFLNDFLSKTKVKKIYLIAHSMGNRILTNALVSIIKESNKMANIQEIILAAPDIDSDYFNRDIAPLLTSSGKPITLYISSTDRALIMSRYFHGYNRVGDRSNNIVVKPGIETVDATIVNTGFLGHSYFGESRLVIEDLYNLINNNLRANKRHLNKKASKNGMYWEFIQ